MGRRRRAICNMAHMRREEESNTDNGREPFAGLVVLHVHNSPVCAGNIDRAASATGASSSCRCLVVLNGLGRPLTLKRSVCDTDTSDVASPSPGDSSARACWKCVSNWTTILGQFRSYSDPLIAHVVVGMHWRRGALQISLAPSGELDQFRVIYSDTSHLGEHPGN